MSVFDTTDGELAITVVIVEAYRHRPVLYTDDTQRIGIVDAMRRGRPIDSGGINIFLTIAISPIATCQREKDGINAILVRSGTRKPDAIHSVIIDNLRMEQR